MLDVPDVIWAAAPDDAIDAHVRAFRDNPAVWCTADPDLYTDDAADSADDETAAAACAGCPIVRACREQALRQEQGAGDSFGIRGGLSAAGRRALIAARPAGAGRTFLPTTWSRPEVIAQLRARGCKIAPNTFSAKATRGIAPRSLVSSSRGSHWDVREIREWLAGDQVVHQHT